MIFRIAKIERKNELKKRKIKKSPNTETKRDQRKLNS